MTDHASGIRLALVAGAAMLGCALLANLAAAHGSRTTRSAGAQIRREVRGAAPRVSRIPLLSRLLGSIAPAAAEAPDRRAAGPPTNGGWTLDDCLAGQRRPDAASEIAVLTSGAGALPAELARTLALEATDRAYHDALAQAAGAAPEAGLHALEAALAETPAAHHIARLRLLDAMLPLARACRALAERQALAARRQAERVALLELAAAAGVLGDEPLARRAVAEADGTQQALEPMLTELLAPVREAGAD